MSQDLTPYCSELVKAGDIDRYLSALFAPAKQRDHLFALYAFNLEVARIPGAVSEAMLGEIRVQWWRETIDGIYAGTVREHEVAQALARGIEASGVDQAGFHAYLDARQSDLYDDPFNMIDDMRRYATATAGFLLKTASAILLPNGDQTQLETAAIEGGLVHTLTATLQSLGSEVRNNRLRLPKDVLDRHQIDSGAIQTESERAKLRAASRELADLALASFGTTQRVVATLDHLLLPAFLSFSLCSPRLKRFMSVNYDPLTEFRDLSLLSKQFRLLWHMGRGRL